MAQQRFRDDGRLIGDFLDVILVVCPRCGARAEVRPLPGTPVVRYTSPRRLTCAACGLSRSITKPTAAFGRATDPYFDLPLALQAPCAGHVVWAYNRTHLDHLLAYVEATIRERPASKPEVPAPPTSLLEKMPAWFGAASNRTPIAAALRRLRASFD
jgi:hypothetical protein